MAKRSFYGDESPAGAAVPVPGTTVPATQAQIESLGPNQLVNGNSIRSPSSLTSFFGSIRGYVDETVACADTKLNELSARYNTKQTQVRKSLVSLKDPREDLMPAGLYVLIGALTGTIVTRRSNVFLKGVVPVAMGLAAFKFVLPNTFHNITSLAHDIEAAKLPELTSAQDGLVKDVGNFVKNTETSALEAEQYVAAKLNESKLSVAKFTGLNLDGDISAKKN